MTRRAFVLFALMSVIWGIPYLLIRVAVAEISPATLVFARTGIAALILLPIAVARLDLRPVLARWRWVVACAAVEVGIPWFLLSSAEERVTSSLAGLLVAGVPLVGMIIAVVTRGRDRVGGVAFLGLLVGLAGVAAIVDVNADASNAGALVEIAIVVVGYAAGPAILARRLGDLPSLGVMAVSLSLCALVYAPLAAAQRPVVMPAADVLVAVAILGVVCTAAAFLCFAALIDEIGPVRATVITYVNPAVAAVLGVVVLNEPFTVAMVAGFALVILGSALATRQPRPAGVAGSVGPQLAPAEEEEPAA